MDATSLSSVNAKRQKVSETASGAALAQQTVEYPFPETEQSHEPDQIEGLPNGWCNCPSMGNKIGYFVPCKTPLGARHLRKIPPGKEFTPGMALQMARERFGQEVGLVIDLTNTKRYYDARDWEEQNVYYRKMPCRGRGQTPEAEVVNAFMWEAMTFADAYPNLLILVHCTHGFNRTGFMIVNYILRMGNGVPFGDNTLEAALNQFSLARQPGIYKDHYITTLYNYHNMRRPSAMRTPNVPTWKGDDSPTNSPERELPEEEEKPNQLWAHDDVLGEPIPYEMAEVLKRDVMAMCRGPGSANSRIVFPGSQPVSLDLQNLSLLQTRRYYVTWKADGTRYLMLLRADGTYLIDRAFKIRRVEMRFPTTDMVPHHGTLLDGEMVVDEDLVSGIRHRRFLVYDMMANRCNGVIDKTFQERFKLIEEELTKPRSKLKHDVAAGKVNYDFSKELFSTRRKDFWQLHTSQKVLDKVITNLTHESDGLIFQSYDDPYISGTCNELLKWKFASHNSVDFKLKMEGGQPVLYLRSSNRAHRGDVPLQGGRIVFPDGDDPSDFHMKIVECRYLKDEDAWEYMRTRTDKDTANAYHVYEKVLKSIHDNITQEVLLNHVAEVVNTSPHYVKEKADMIKRQQSAARN